MIRVSICINIWNDAYRCRTSRIQKRHSFHKLSTAGTFQTCEHLACKSAPTITNNFSLNSCALGDPDLAEFKYSSAREGQSANRGAGSTCTRVFHGISSNVEKPPVKSSAKYTTCSYGSVGIEWLSPEKRLLCIFQPTHRPN